MSLGAVCSDDGRGAGRRTATSSCSSWCSSTSRCPGTTRPRCPPPPLPRSPSPSFDPHSVSKDGNDPGNKPRILMSPLRRIGRSNPGSEVSTVAGSWE